MKRAAHCWAVSAVSAVCAASAVGAANTLSAAPAAVADSGEMAQRAWVERGATGLDLRAAEALAQINGSGRKLLALRAYLRAGDSLRQRWSWPAEKLAAYPNTEEGKAAYAAIDTVAAAFETVNPGFTLRVNRQPRSLEEQIAHWNENASVGAAAAALVGALRGQLERDPRGREGRDMHAVGSRDGDGNGVAAGARDAPSAPAIKAALVAWAPSTSFSLAAPGLSAHGQARAFDFQIARGDQIIAGTEFATARERWDATGWTAKLHAAVHAAGDRFVGPLKSPNEPWHYTYQPQAHE